eukprot:s60_g69.t1
MGCDQSRQLNRERGSHSGLQEEECVLGIFEWLTSSYNGESEVSKTIPGERRTGRVGTFMVCLAGYAISASLKLLVPPSSSSYYKREDGPRNQPSGRGVEGLESVERQSLSAGEDPEMPPIFTTHLWKRSALALLVYINGALQICLLRCAFSDMYKDNIQFFLFTLFVIRITIKVAFTSFMCELMLTVPIAITNQTLAVFTLLAAPTLFDFLESDDDQKKFEDADEMELEGETEEMISFLATISADSVANLVVPTFYVAFSSALPASFARLFYLLMYPFQVIADRICVNIAECYHGWKVTDYLEYCSYRFIIRTTDWKGRDNILDQTLSPHVRSIDQMCFSDQFYFVNLLQTVGVMSLIFGMQVTFEAQWNMFEDPATPAVLAYAICLCKGVHLRAIFQIMFHLP